MSKTRKPITTVDEFWDSVLDDVPVADFPCTAKREKSGIALLAFVLLVSIEIWTVHIMAAMYFIELIK